VAEDQPNSTLVARSFFLPVALLEKLSDEPPNLTAAIRRAVTNFLIRDVDAEGRTHDE